MMAAAGFVLVENGSVYVLKGTDGALKAAQGKNFKFPEVTPAMADTLWRRKAELEAILRSMEKTLLVASSDDSHEVALLERKHATISMCSLQLARKELK